MTCEARWGLKPIRLQKLKSSVFVGMTCEARWGLKRQRPRRRTLLRGVGMTCEARWGLKLMLVILLASSSYSSE